MTNYNFRMKEPLKLSEGRLRGDRKALVPMKISSSPLTSINGDLSLTFDDSVYISKLYQITDP